MEERCQCHQPCEVRKSHVHEVLGSVGVVGECNLSHNHRFASMTGKEILVENGQHIHELCFRTDSFEGHNHEFIGRTGPAVKVGKGHTHFLESVTSKNFGHTHCFKLLTLIENPLEV
ncbi:MAG: hypothetical protein KHY88_02170 [Erysipelotrichaceae bacterium]|nr:hypothetical protein [Erysipelotrichaceae bacterium]